MEKKIDSSKYSFIFFPSWSPLPNLEGFSAKNGKNSYIITHIYLHLHHHLHLHLYLHLHLHNIHDLHNLPLTKRWEIVKIKIKPTILFIFFCWFCSVRYNYKSKFRIILSDFFILCPLVYDCSYLTEWLRGIYRGMYMKDLQRVCTFTVNS